MRPCLLLACSLLLLLLRGSSGYLPAAAILRPLRSLSSSSSLFSSSSSSSFKGCSITPDPSNPTVFSLAIDGAQADLAKFSAAIYKKVLKDASAQRFQGFRPGTVPPHLLPAYVSFAMDETAREAALEGMGQNGLLPFEGTRAEMEVTELAFVPGRKGKKPKGKKKGAGEVAEGEPEPVVAASVQEAAKAGWQPGTCFSFVAKVKGQEKGIDVLGRERDSNEMVGKAIEAVTDRSNS
jgi:hypothetical protein